MSIVDIRLKGQTRFNLAIAEKDIYLSGLPSITYSQLLNFKVKRTAHKKDKFHEILKQT